VRPFLSIIDSLSEWSGKFFSFLVVAATLIVTFDVVLRYAFDAPTKWGLEVTIFLCGITYVMAGAYAHLFDAHVRVDALYMRWTPRVKAIVDLATAPLFFLVCGVLVWEGSKWTAESIIGADTSGSIWDPIVWPIRLLIPLGCLLLFLQGLAKFIRDFGIARRARGSS